MRLNALGCAQQLNGQVPAYDGLKAQLDDPAGPEILLNGVNVSLMSWAGRIHRMDLA